MTTIQTIAIISPLVSAALTAYLSYKLTSKSKKVDIVYENKIPAFKAIASNIISFKNFCEGRVAYFLGSEFHPFYTESLGTLEHRTKIALSLEENAVFISRDSRRIISDFINEMSGLCSAELAIASHDPHLGPKDEYERMAILADSAVEILYEELNLPDS